ncbi:MAG: hypothetical protein ACI88A_004854 [Paraglaciecola sp.]|jgi:hypothetical protein
MLIDQQTLYLPYTRNQSLLINSLTVINTKPTPFNCDFKGTYKNTYGIVNRCIFLRVIIECLVLNLEN